MFYKKRVVILSMIAFLLVLVLSNFFYLQVIQFDRFNDRAMNKVVRTLPIEAPRGLIKDRNGKNIVLNSKVYDVQVVPYDVRPHFNHHLLKRYIDYDTILIKKKIDNYRKSFSSKFTPISIKNKLAKDTIFIIEEQREQFPGLVIREVFSREYDYKSNIHLAHVLGETVIDRRSAYNPIFDIIDIKPIEKGSGLEKYYNDLLKGEDGKEFHLFDITGMDRGVYSNEMYQKVMPVTGSNLLTTIDIKLQNFIAELLDGLIGTAICMNPSTGEIIAYVNSPTIDLYKMDYNYSLFENSPFLNRAINPYEPGSIMKVPVAIMLIEEGFDPNVKYFCDGAYEFLSPNQKPKRCWKEDGHGEVDLNKAIRVSCNVYFYNSVMNNYQKVYKNKWDKWMKKLGFGNITNIDLIYEKASSITSPSSKSKMLNMVLGQEMRATPIQVIQMINSVFNKGFLIQPHFNSNLSVSKIDLNLKNSTIEYVKKAMRGAVKSGDGTAKRSNIENVEIMAKTGTAQQGGGKMPHAWYAGCLKYKGHMLSLVVMLENGGKGGEQPAEIAKKIFNKYITLNLE